MDLSRKIARLGRMGASRGGAASVAVEERDHRSPGASVASVPALEPVGGAEKDPRERVRQARIAHLRSLLVDFEARANARAERAREERVRAGAGGGAPPPLPGLSKETPSGRVRLAEHELPPDHFHGSVAVARGLAADAETLAKLALDASIADVDLSGALFLDTETTGLTGGTGTIPFLIGFARFEGGALKLYQLFLEAPGEEAPMLELLREAVERSTLLVTYNGKSYDWPLLSTRFVMNRVAPPAPRPHLDLVHIARRLFRLRLGTAKLTRMEEEILEMRRERDIDGAEIPGVYWSYLRHRDATQVATVMEHNANDLVALAALMGVVSERYAALHVHDDPRDHLCLARTAVRADDPSKAFEFARAAAEGGGAPETTVQANLLLAELLKKGRDFRGAVRALEEAVEAAGRGVALAAPAHLMLAKLHEHRTKDFAQALAHAAWTASEEGVIARDHRIARLSRRQRRATEEAAKAARRAAREAARQGQGARRPVAAVGRSVVLSGR